MAELVSIFVSIIQRRWPENTLQHDFIGTEQPSFLHCQTPSAINYAYPKILNLHTIPNSHTVLEKQKNATPKARPPFRQRPIHHNNHHYHIRTQTFQTRTSTRPQPCSRI
jgi:hypothetical protein